MRNKIAYIFSLLCAVALCGCTLDITRDHLRVSILRDTSSQRTTVTTSDGSKVTFRGNQAAISGPALQAAISGAGQIFLHAFGL